MGAVIGRPVSHSLSPAIHEAAFLAAGRSGRFLAIDCDEAGAGAVIEQMRARGAVGLSVTMPLKDVVVDLVDELSEDARTLRAVNCIEFRDGRSIGHNTDGDGCCDALESVGHARIGGSTAVVLGAGGAGRSVALGLLRRGAHVVIVNRTAARAEGLVDSLADEAAASGGSIGVGAADSISGASILVNTTSVGMNSDELPVSPSLLHAGLVVLDAVYSPLDTALSRAARVAGATTVDGLWMLIDQACRQQMVWFGRSPDRAAMREAAERELASRQK